MESDDETVKSIYAHYGVAMYLGQILEHGIVNALVILRLPNKTLCRQDIDDFMDGRFKKTLGALIRQLKAESSLTVELEALLTSSLEKRNFLAHGYFRERAESFVTQKGCNKMLGELQQFQKEFERTEKLLFDAMKTLRTKYGVTDEFYANEYENLCNKIGIKP